MNGDRCSCSRESDDSYRANNCPPRAAPTESEMSGGRSRDIVRHPLNVMDRNSSFPHSKHPSRKCSRGERAETRAYVNFGAFFLVHCFHSPLLSPRSLLQLFIHPAFPPCASSHDLLLLVFRFALACEASPVVAYCRIGRWPRDLP